MYVCVYMYMCVLKCIIITNFKFKILACMFSLGLCTHIIHTLGTMHDVFLAVGLLEEDEVEGNLLSLFLSVPLMSLSWLSSSSLHRISIVAFSVFYNVSLFY